MIRFLLILAIIFLSLLYYKNMDKVDNLSINFLKREKTIQQFNNAKDIRDYNLQKVKNY